MGCWYLAVCTMAVQLPTPVSAVVCAASAATSSSSNTCTFCPYTPVAVNVMSSVAAYVSLPFANNTFSATPRSDVSKANFPSIKMLPMPPTLPVTTSARASGAVRAATTLRATPIVRALAPQACRLARAPRPAPLSPARTGLPIPAILEDSRPGARRRRGARPGLRCECSARLAAASSPRTAGPTKCAPFWLRPDAATRH
mmetsp:Transcript_7281/g.26056  ORF Transcript_7281/g.26056 Transcript_7281/m.26056 type:complete len:200 (-) Transcript_7281:77-676(-)